MEKLLAVSFGGAAGALTRYGAVLVFDRIGWQPVPFGILAVNVGGSFLFGLVWSALEDRGTVSDSVRLLILTGFLGSLTTFSTFAFDSVQLGRGGNWVPFAANLLLNNGCSLAAVWLGFRAARVLD